MTSLSTLLSCCSGMLLIGLFLGDWAFIVYISESSLHEGVRMRDCIGLFR